MFDWVEIGGIGRLISHIYTSFLKPFLNFISCIDRYVVLYENKVVYIVRDD